MTKTNKSTNQKDVEIEFVFKLRANYPTLPDLSSLTLPDGASAIISLVTTISRLF